MIRLRSVLCRRCSTLLKLRGLASSLSGCGSLHEWAEHPDRKATGECYEGTWRDYQYLRTPANGARSSIYKCFLGGYLTVACAVGNLVRLLVGLIVDTAHLLHDMPRYEQIKSGQSCLIRSPISASVLRRVSNPAMPWAQCIDALACLRSW